MILGLLASCVDDYTDANPPRKLDAPTLRLSATGDVKLATVPVNAYQYTYEAYVTYSPVEFTVSIIDAPGKIGSVSVTNSVPGFGDVTINEASVNAIKGATTGSFKFTFTPNPELEDESDRSVNLTVVVTDSQLDEKGEAAPKSTTMVIPTKMQACVSEGIAGVYQVTAADFNFDGGALGTLDDLETDNEGPIFVELTQDLPGRFSIDEVTGGVWPVYYPGRANPVVEIDYCDPDLAGHPGGLTVGGLRTFAVEGMVNGDGTIEISWSYVRVDGNTPANPAKGTYTLTPVE